MILKFQRSGIGVYYRRHIVQAKPGSRTNRNRSKKIEAAAGEQQV
jgi:hypothetical protein